MNVDEDEDEQQAISDIPLVPMPASGGIQELREKLHARMAALRRGGSRDVDGTAGGRDELIEERRRHRAEMRERRRKETREKIRREEEAKTKRNKDKEQQQRTKGPQTKVCTFMVSLCTATQFTTQRINFSYPTSRLLLVQSNPHQVLRTLHTRSLALAKRHTTTLRLLLTPHKLWLSSLFAKRSSHQCQKRNGKKFKRKNSGRRPKLGWKVSKYMMMNRGSRRLRSVKKRRRQRARRIGAS